jgi:hypothetical protein
MQDVQKQKCTKLTWLRYLFIQRFEACLTVNNSSSYLKTVNKKQIKAVPQTDSIFNILTPSAK